MPRSIIHPYVYLRLGLLHITTAASTPGTHPAMVKRVTIKIDPQPLSNTASGGSTMHKMALAQLMILSFIGRLLFYHCQTWKKPSPSTGTARFG
jgi:hypothetical protein